MAPIYKYELSTTGPGTPTRSCFPIFKSNLSKDYELETNEQFFRAKLNGKITFLRDDYNFIVSKAFDTEFRFTIYISYNAGETWDTYWKGMFFKTNCTFDEDNQSVTLTPELLDQYSKVLAGLEKEYDLINLAPAIVPVKMDKRPMIQVYVPGQTVIGCFLSGMWWEQECKAVDNKSALENTYHFAKNKTLRIVDISGSMLPQLPDVMTAQNVNDTLWSISGSGFTLRYAKDTSDPEDNFTYYEIVRNSDNVRLWYCRRTNGYEYPPQNVTLTPVPGTDASGNVTLYIHDISVYARYVTDVEQAMGLNTYPIPNDDIVENNRNYRYVIGYYFPNTIWFSNYLTTTPTKWGIYQPGLYYDSGIPPSVGVGDAYPIARSAWGRISLWFVFDVFDWITEQHWRKEHTLKDAFPIWSVISVLLAKVAPGITHVGTTDYSQFLYGTNPIANIDQWLFITPKSNVISSGYDQPAQKAPITLKQVTDMLRDCFRCYWFIDEQNRFRIEHISYFMRGGTYTGQPVVGIDLTKQIVTRNGKPWSFARNQYGFDKPEMAARYQFGWMDDVTQEFEGNPLDVISQYVNQDKVENINVALFTSDVDYILLNPSRISRDGFVLLGAQKTQTSSVRTVLMEEYGIDSDLYDLYSLSSYESKTVKISAGCGSSGPLNLALANSEGSVIYLHRFVPGEIKEINIEVPPGYTRLVAVNSDGSIAELNWIDVFEYSYKLPYYDFTIDEKTSVLQNGWVSFAYLQQYYAFDMPAMKYKMNGQEMNALGVKKLKTQTLQFPALEDPDMLKLIRTNLGDGAVQKMSINLETRNANTTLKYATEQ